MDVKFDLAYIAMRQAAAEFGAFFSDVNDERLMALVEDLFQDPRSEFDPGTPDKHPFVQDLGEPEFYCKTCGLPRANQRHDTQEEEA